MSPILAVRRPCEHGLQRHAPEGRPPAQLHSQGAFRRRPFKSLQQRHELFSELKVKFAQLHRQRNATPWLPRFGAAEKIGQLAHQLGIQLRIFRRQRIAQLLDLLKVSLPAGTPQFL